MIRLLRSFFLWLNEDKMTFHSSEFVESTKEIAQLESRFNSKYKGHKIAVYVPDNIVICAYCNEQVNSKDLLRHAFLCKIHRPPVRERDSRPGIVPRNASSSSERTK